MRFPSWMACVLIAAIATPLQAQQVSQTARLGTCFTRPANAPMYNLGVNLDDADGPVYFLQASFDDFKSLPLLIGPLPIGADGMASIGGQLNASLIPNTTKLSFRALFKDGPWVKKTNIASVVFNAPGCELFDPNYGVADIGLGRGEIVAEQWSPVGMHVAAQSFDPFTEPNKCIILDTGNTLEPDQVTPGYGPGNDTALGNIMIVAENVIDADNDGFVDEPDDSFDGGIIMMTFDEPKTICSGTFTDIDDAGIAKMRFYSDAAGTNLITNVTIPNAGDNSVQTVFVHVDGVRRLDLKGGGSFGVARISGCPTRIDFDQNTWGRLVNLATGEEITDQFASNGLTITADNAHPAHPDKAILFDTANPTGDDTDLATPGYHPSNTVARNKVLIIAENDVDANFDGFVDDPDDEAYGGTINFTFDFDVKMLVLTVIDVDGLENSSLECRNAANVLIDVAPLVILGDNSVQTILMPAGGVRSLRFVNGGSGAIADITYCPDL